MVKQDPHKEYAVLCRTIIWKKAELAALMEKWKRFDLTEDWEEVKKGGANDNTLKRPTIYKKV